MPPTKLLAAIAAASLLVAACGDDDDATEPAEVGDATQGIAGVTVEGDGEEVPAGATVTVHYAGVLLDGTEFDASFGGQPATFPLGGVIPGWTEGLPGMKVGGRRLLVIPSDLAYGAAGFEPVIPPDSPLVFVVDMLDVG